METIELTETARQRGGSARLHAHLVRPSGEGPWPGVVMLHEAFGVNDVFLRQAERLAEAGYLALALDLFSDGGARRCLVRSFRAMLSGEGTSYVDIDVARTWLAESSECTGKVGVIGFCMGGGFALLTASRGFEAASVNYGQLPKELDAVAADACPVVGSFGKKDVTLPNAAVKLDKALTAAGVPNDVKEYPEAGHSFLNDAEVGPRPLRPLMRVAGVGPEPDSAADAWRRIEDFFATHLR